MDDLIREIRAAVDGGAWVLALFGTLALPDICAALQSENGETTGSKYKRWIRTNLGDSYPRLDADELWQMRCSMLHQGTSATRGYSRILFFPPGPVYSHNAVIDDALCLDLIEFCEDVLAAVSKWQSDHMLDPTVVKNAPSLVRWHRGGLPPYVVGLDVLS